MAQVFISYKREDRQLTEDLARDLEARGYAVWWDTRLVSGDDVDDVIVRAIDEAKAAIVIWTPNSVGSKWVRSEVRRADRQGKLIPVRVPDLDLNDIPPPFDGYHMDLVGDPERIVAALAARGLLPNGGRLSKAESLDALYHAVGRGDVAAMLKLGRMYNTGDGVQPDVTEAIRLYKLAAQAGEVDAITELEKLVFRKAYSPEDAYSPNGQEWVWFLQLVVERKPNSPAIGVWMLELAKLYDGGHVVPKDPTQAAQWALRALQVKHGAPRTLRAQIEGGHWSMEFRRATQRLLKESAVFVGPVDGVFGPETIRSLERIANKGQ